MLKSHINGFLWNYSVFVISSLVVSKMCDSLNFELVRILEPIVSAECKWYRMSG